MFNKMKNLCLKLSGKSCYLLGALLFCSLWFCGTLNAKASIDNQYYVAQTSAGYPFAQIFKANHNSITAFSIYGIKYYGGGTADGNICQVSGPTSTACLGSVTTIGDEDNDHCSVGGLPQEYDAGCHSYLSRSPAYFNYTLPAVITGTKDNYYMIWADAGILAEYKEIISYPVSDGFMYLV